MERSDVHVPANTPDEMIDAYIDNYLAFTKGTNNGFLFAGDQKIEHLNEDFYGEGIADDDADPEHLFRIASQAPVGCFAAQHGLISKYARDYPTVPYLIKMNSKTPLVPGEPLSLSLVDFADVLALRDNGVHVIGIGYTLYLGSEHESAMLHEAGRLIAQAHEQGMIAVLWIYPRGRGVEDAKSPSIIAGATGTACSLGADFVKVTQPLVDGEERATDLIQAVRAAGRTRVIVSGGSAEDAGPFLHLVWEHVNEAGCAGAAVGRNVHQRSEEEAIRMCKAIAAIVYEGKSTHDAYQIYEGD